MNRKKSVMIVTLLVLAFLHARADYRTEVYHSYINDSMELWRSVIDRMEAAKGKNNEMILELINYQYGYIGYCIEFNKYDEARNYFSMAEKNIKKIEASGYYGSLMNAYKSAIYGFRISFNKLSAPFNGPKSLNYAMMALEQDGQNYLANIQYGDALSNMPAAFGGSKKEALEYYLKAKHIIERDPDNTKFNWNYMHLQVLIARIYVDLEDFYSAKMVYDNILTAEPGFKYVKNDLYPKLLSKMKK